MSGTLERAYGYKGDSMNLPVADVETALPFYETVLGFQMLSRATLRITRPSLAAIEFRCNSSRTAAIPRRMAVRST